MAVRIAVLGAGRHSTKNHGPALARIAKERRDDVELRAVCDLDTDRANTYAESFGFSRTYTDYERMLTEESLDGVVAITPRSATREIAGDLFHREPAVLIEKPPGESATETRELLEIAERTGSDHMVSFNRRFNPAIRRAREWLESRDVAPTFGSASLLRSDRLEPDFPWSTGIHAVDTVLSFLPAPTRVDSRRWRSRPEGGESCEGRIACESETTAHVTLAPDVGRRAETYDVLGPQFSIRVDVEAATVDIEADGETGIEWRADPDAPHAVRNGTVGETAAFVEAIDGTRPFSPTLSEGLEAMATVEALDAGGTRTLDSSGD